MSSASCISIIGYLILGFMVVVAVPVIVYEVVVKPKNPTFTLERASVTGFNLTSEGHLTAFFDVMIRAHNPNHKRKLGYGDLRVYIFKDKHSLAEDTLSSFTQRNRNVTFLQAQPVALNVGLKKGPSFDFGLESGMGYLDFDVLMTARLNVDNLVVNCQCVLVNVTSSPAGFFVDAPSLVNDNNPGKFRSIGCSVYVYSDPT